MDLNNTIKSNLINAALKAKLRSHSPHSGFRVGAAVLTASGNIYPGTNVEFDAYSLTICAERSALFNAISNGEKEIIAIAITTEREDFKSPCGLCRQALIEFNEKMIIILINKNKKTKKLNLKNLLPNYFKLKK